MPQSDLKEETRYLLTLPVDPDSRTLQLPPDEELSAVRAIALSQVEKALAGDQRAAAFVREMTGEDGDGVSAGPPTLETLLSLLEEQGL